MTTWGSWMQSFGRVANARRMRRCVLSATAVLAATTAGAADNLISGKVTVVKPTKLAKFVAKSATGFTLPAAGGGEDPTVQGAQLRLLDTLDNGATGGGEVSFTLPAGGWSGLGTPAGSKGYKFKGSSVASACTVVLIKEKVIKGVCKGATVVLHPPFLGDLGVLLSIPDGATPAVRYCATFGGTTLKNDASMLKRKDAPAPDVCAVAQPTATVTQTRTATATNPPTNTATTTGTATRTPTTTNTPLGGIPTQTPTSTFTPTSAAASCGNRVLEPDETCVSCPQDCVIGPCNSPGAPTQAFTVDLVPPTGFSPTTVTVLLSYNSTKLSIPGTGTATSVRQRVVAPPPLPQAFTPNDKEYAVQVLISRNVPLGQLFTATFDHCSGSAPATLADVACTVLSCAQGGGAVAGCTCAARFP